MSEGRLVRVPTAFGAGGEAMTRAAMMDIGVEEAATVAEATVSEQTQRVRVGAAGARRWCWEAAAARTLAPSPGWPTGRAGWRWCGSTPTAT